MAPCIRLCAAALALLVGQNAFAETPSADGGAAETAASETIEIAWTGHGGWAPWGYMYGEGRIHAWAERYGLDIEIVKLTTYQEALDAYAAGELAGGTLSSIDALALSSRHGVDSTVILVEDFSSGKDAVVAAAPVEITALVGGAVHAPRNSEAHYLLGRCLELAGFSEADVTLVDTAEDRIVDAFRDGAPAVATWNPYLQAVKASGGHVVCDSRATPGEIMGLMVIRTEVLEAHPDLGRALVGAWYETLAEIQAETAEGAAARDETAALVDMSPEDYRDAVFSARALSAGEGARFLEGPALRDIISFVRRFLFTHGMLGQNVKSMDGVGVLLANGDYIGDPSKLALRFDATYLREIAERGAGP